MRSIVGSLGWRLEAYGATGGGDWGYWGPLGAIEVETGAIGVNTGSTGVEIGAIGVEAGGTGVEIEDLREEFGTLGVHWGQ